MRWTASLHRLMATGGLASVYLVPAILINLGNAAAYLFQVLLGRTLDVAQFGQFNAVFSALLILTAPSNFLPLLVAQAAMAGPELGQQRRLLTRFAILATLGAGVLTALGVLLAAIAGRRFDMDLATGLAAFCVIVFSCLHPITVGLIQARQRYIGAAFVVGGNPLLRLIFGLLLVGGLGLGPAGAMWAVALPVAATFLLGLVLLRDLRRARPAPLSVATQSVLRHAAWRQALSVTLLAAISNMDVVMARLILPEGTAGLYAGAAIVSRIGLLLPSALATIIFTEAARAPGAKLWTGLALTAGMAGAIALVFVLGGEWVITLLLGPSFAGAGGLLALTGLAMATLAVTQALVMTLAGRGHFGYLAALSLATLTLGATPPLLGLGAQQLALLTLGVNLALFAVILLQTVAVTRPSPNAPAASRPARPEEP